VKVYVKNQVETSQSARVRQLEGMFDCPTPKIQTKQWSINAPIEERPWNVGLIVGPSGSGKSTVARQMFGDAVDRRVEWNAKATIDDFDPSLSIEQIADVCRAVGFNTIPAWMRPFEVLSTGEKFRVELARRILEHQSPIVVDEFTSVVDRQVAQIASHAIAKYARKRNIQFVAVSCHSDIIDWLQPDWIIEPSIESFSWRSVLRRPTLDVEIIKTHYSEWRRFAPFHYLTAELAKAARCFVGLINGEPAVFCGVLYRMHPKSKGIYGLSRLVTLPDYQGLGAAMAVTDKLASCYKALGARFRTYPAHPSLIRSFDHSRVWSMERNPGGYNILGPTSILAHDGIQTGRPCAVFEYRGKPHESASEALNLIGAGIKRAA